MTAPRVGISSCLLGENVRWDGGHKRDVWLKDAPLREHFVERVFAHRRWRDLAAAPFRARDLVDFHARHKLQLLAHSPDHYRRLGPLVARAKAAVRDDYGLLFMEGLSQKATRGRHVNVLQHMAGYFKEGLSSEERRGIEEAIADYRAREVALEVPVRLIRQGARRLKVAYLLQQTYFDPVPAGLKLRNHV